MADFSSSYKGLCLKSGPRQTAHGLPSVSFSLKWLPAGSPSNHLSRSRKPVSGNPGVAIGCVF